MNEIAKEKRFFSDGTILTCSICVVLSFLCQIFKITPLVNIIYVFSLAFVMITYFASGYVSTHMIWLSVLTVFTALARGENFSEPDYTSHLLICLCSFVCIEMSTQVEMKEKTAKTVAYMFMVTTAILALFYYFGSLKNSYYVSEYGLTTDAIALNLHNPNAAGLWVACIFAVMYYCAFMFEGLKKIAFFALAVATIPIVLATDSRNSYYACILLLVALPIAKIFKIKKVPKWVLAVIAVLPIIVFFFYMYVVVENMSFWEGIFGGGSIDKGIDTRRSIWNQVLNSLGDCFLLGNYPEYFDKQMHNSLMTIYCRHGAIVTGLLSVLIYNTLVKLQEKATFSGVLSLAAVLFTGCFEASVFIGVAGLYLMLMIIPAIAGAEYKKSSRKEEIVARAYRSSGRRHF